jgi:hypothetical protein
MCDFVRMYVFVYVWYGMIWYVSYSMLCIHVSYVCTYVCMYDLYVCTYVCTYVLVYV